MALERKEIYWTHDELCEHLGIPKKQAILVDDNALCWWPPAEMWRLSVKVGTTKEVDEAIANGD